MKPRTLPNQIAFDLFDKPKHMPPSYEKPCPIRESCGAYHCETGGCNGERGWCKRAQEARTPTWDDVQKGRAKLMDFIEPCKGEECMFWQGGECVHVPGKFGYPKKRPGGMCLVHRIVWKEEQQ